MTTNRVLAFAELGRAVCDLSAEFAEPFDSFEVFDPQILQELRRILEQSIGRVDRIFDVTVDESDTFKGRAKQRISLNRSQFYEFEAGDRSRYKLIDAKDALSFADSEEGFSAIVEFTSVSGKQLKCKPGNIQCGKRCQGGGLNCYDGMSSTQKAAAKALAAKAKRVASSKVGDLSKADLESALMKKFNVNSIQELRGSGAFAMANGGNPPNGNQIRQTSILADQYRKLVGVIPNDPANQTGVYGVVNGINIFKYQLPWETFGLDSKSASGDDVKKAYRRLSKLYHPDNSQTGDAEIFQKLNNFYQSLTQKF